MPARFKDGLLCHSRCLQGLLRGPPPVSLLPHGGMNLGSPDDERDTANKSVEGVEKKLLSAACCDAGTAHKAQTSCPALVETLARRGLAMHNSKMYGSDTDLTLLDVRQTQGRSLRLTTAIT